MKKVWWWPGEKEKRKIIKKKHNAPYSYTYTYLYLPDWWISIVNVMSHSRQWLHFYKIHTWWTSHHANIFVSVYYIIPYWGFIVRLAGLWWVNRLRPGQNGRRFADDTLKCIFLNENDRISIKISLKFVPKGSINNILALVQKMAWRWPGDKPLSESMMFSLPTHISVTQPQWVNNAYTAVLHWTTWFIVVIMQCPV